MKQRLMDHLDFISTREIALTTRFYEILFERYPQVRAMFGRRSEEAQAKMLQEAIVAVVEHLDDEAWLGATLASLGRTHVVYGVTPEMYGWVGACLLQALQELSGDRWDAELAQAWATAYGRISATMIEAQVAAVA